MKNEELRGNAQATYLYIHREQRKREVGVEEGVSRKGGFDRGRGKNFTCRLCLLHLSLSGLRLRVKLDRSVASKERNVWA
jgi:hypothetical protein